MEKIAIVGMGISGMAILRAYEKLVDKKDFAIDCYDTRESYGKGFPFKSDSGEALLNVRPEGINYDFADSNDFTDFLDQISYSYQSYVPRSLVGTYMRGHLDESLEKTGGHLIYRKIVDISYLEESNTFKLVDDSSNARIYDRVHLCCGQMPQVDHYNLSAYSNYVNEIYPMDHRLGHIEKNSSIGVLGTSLSAIDAYRYLYANSNPQKIIMASRSASFATVRHQANDIDIKYFNDENIKSIIDDNNSYISFEDVDKLFEMELEDKGVSYDILKDRYDDKFNTVINSLDPDVHLIGIQSIFQYISTSINLVWQHMTKAHREKFLNKYGFFIQAFGGPIPLNTGRLLVDKYKEGELEILAGLEDISYDKATDKFEIIAKGQRPITVDYVINATGIDRSLRSLDSPNNLIGHILDKRLGTLNPNKGLSVLADDYSLISPKYGRLERLHAHGMLISGVQIRNNSIPTIQKSSLRIIKTIYKK